VALSAVAKFAKTSPWGYHVARQIRVIEAKPIFSLGETGKNKK
jgi:hypothetical protein